MDSRWLAGFGISLLGGVASLALVLTIFVSTFETQIQAEVARGSPTEALLASYVLPGVAVVGLLGGVLWLVAMYGFAVHRRWAYVSAMGGSVLCVLGGFFPILPWVSSGLGFPPTSLVFALNLVLFVLLQVRVMTVTKTVLLFGLLAGMAYILAFINGVAGTHYIITTGGVYFELLQPVNFAASAIWAAATVAIVLRKEWSEPTALAGGIASVIGGVPLALLTQTELARPSLFWPSPLLSLVLLAAFFLTGKGRSVTRPGQ